jgi:hypothetical protein
MAKQLNPMPPSAKSARRTLWIQVLLAVLLGAALVAAQQYKRNWVPAIAADNVYRTAAGLAAAAIVLLLMTVLMRYQWRWLWLLLLLVELATLGGLVWTGVRHLNWFIVVALAIIPLVAIFGLLNRVSRRWFHH